MVVWHLKLNLTNLIQDTAAKYSGIKTDSHKLLTSTIDDYVEAIFNSKDHRGVIFLFVELDGSN